MRQHRLTKVGSDDLGAFGYHAPSGKVRHLPDLIRRDPKAGNRGGGKLTVKLAKGFVWCHVWPHSPARLGEVIVVLRSRDSNKGAVATAANTEPIRRVRISVCGRDQFLWQVSCAKARCILAG